MKVETAVKIVQSRRRDRFLRMMADVRPYRTMTTGELWQKYLEKNPQRIENHG